MPCGNVAAVDGDDEEFPDSENFLDLRPVSETEQAVELYDENFYGMHVSEEPVVALTEEHAYEDHLDIHVCVESFAGRIPCDLLKVLSSLNYSQDNKEATEKYGSYKLNMLRSRVQADLENALSGTGLRIYLGTVKNGSVSDVIVCAKDEEEAMTYFRKFGAVLKKDLCSSLKIAPPAPVVCRGAARRKRSLRKSASKQMQLSL